MKYHYYEIKCTTYIEILNTMIDVYVAVLNKNIYHYFKHIRIINKLIIKDHISCFFSERYHSRKRHKKIHQ